MGPSDPFSSLPRPPSPPEATPPSSGTAARSAGAAPGGAGSTTDGPGRVRVQASPPQSPTRRSFSTVLVGAVTGLAFGLVTVIWGLGPALLVLAFGGLGAAVGALVRAAADGGLDLGGAWRALRRR